MLETQPVPPARPPRQPIFTAPPGTVLLCLTLVISHLMTVLAGTSARAALLETFAFVPQRFLARVVRLDVPSPDELLTLVSHAFVHGDSMHLILNAGFLLAFGSLVERRGGACRLLAVFFGSVIAGAVVQALVDPAETGVMIGASSGVYGAMGAAGRLMFADGLGAQRRRALAFVAVILGLNVVLGALGLADLLAGAQVAWQAHVGGFLAGLLLATMILPARR